MALKREKQQATLANRIAVKRGAGYTSAAASVDEATRNWDQLVGNFTAFHLKELKIEGELRGQKKARETEFGTKEINYIDNTGYSHTMEMITPVAPPEDMGHAERISYDRHIYIQYKDAVKNSLSRIVTTTSKEIKSSGGTMEEFQSIAEGKTSKYIEQLPSEFKQVAGTMVNEKMAYLAPDVHESHLKLISDDASNFISTKQTGVTKRYFEAIIVNNPEEIAALETDIKELGELIATSPHLKTDFQKYNKYQELKSEIDFYKNLNILTKGALHHNPSDELSDHGATIENLSQVKSMLDNPSIASVTLVGDDNKPFILTRDQLKKNVNEEYWHHAINKAKPRFDSMISATSSVGKKYKRSKELISFYEEGGLLLKDSEDFFADKRVMSQAVKDYANEKGISDEKEMIEIPGSMRFQGWLLENHRVINPLISRKYKNFLMNLDARGLEEVDLVMFHEIAQIPNSNAKLQLSEQAKNSKRQIVRYMKEYNKGFQEAVELARDNREVINLEKETDKLKTYAKYIDLDDYKKSPVIGIGSKIHDVLEDEGAIVGHVADTTLKQQILDRVKLGETVTDEVIEDHVEEWLSDVESGLDREFAFSYSSLSGVGNYGDTYRPNKKVISRHSAEVFYKASDGEVNYIIPLLREKIKAYYKNTPDPRVNSGSWELEETFEDSNVKLSVVGNPAREDPEFGVYYYPGGVVHPVGFSDSVKLMTINKEEFSNERRKYEHYLKFGDGTWEEFRAANG